MTVMWENVFPHFTYVKQIIHIISWNCRTTGCKMYLKFYFSDAIAAQQSLLKHVSVNSLIMVQLPGMKSFLSGFWTFYVNCTVSLLIFFGGMLTRFIESHNDLVSPLVTVSTFSGKQARLINSLASQDIKMCVLLILTYSNTITWLWGKAGI